MRILLSATIVLNFLSFGKFGIAQTNPSNLSRDELRRNGWVESSSFPFLRKKVPTISSPKSVNFSPDGTLLVVTSLGENKVYYYDASTLKVVRKISVTGREPTNSSAKGFAEGEFHLSSEDFWFSRMATGTFFVHDFGRNLTSKEFDAGGSWTKVVRFSPDQTKLAFAHWGSENLVIVDVATKKILKTYRTADIPRGIAWLDNDRLATAIFGDENRPKKTGGVQIFDLKAGAKIADLPVQQGVRDLKYDADRGFLYFSNIRYHEAHKYRLTLKVNPSNETAEVDESALVKSVTLAKYYKPGPEAHKHARDPKQAGEHPNTIQLSPDGTRLYVSSRGPNNPAGYEKASLISGDLAQIDTENFSVLKRWQAGNQPTGLSLSTDGKFLAGTDFASGGLTIYKVDEAE